MYLDIMKDGEIKVHGFEYGVPLLIRTATPKYVVAYAKGHNSWAAPANDSYVPATYHVFKVERVVEIEDDYGIFLEVHPVMSFEAKKQAAFGQLINQFSKRLAPAKNPES